MVIFRAQAAYSQILENFQNCFRPNSYLPVQLISFTKFVMHKKETFLSFKVLGNFSIFVTSSSFWLELRALSFKFDFQNQLNYSPLKRDFNHIFVLIRLQEFKSLFSKI